MLEKDADQSILFRHALFPLLKELQSTDKILYELYKIELENLFNLSQVNNPKKEHLAYETWQLYIDPRYEGHSYFYLGEMNYISFFNALAVFHKLPKELSDTNILELLPNTVTAQDLIDPY
jgi:hypothetical protein